MDPWSMPVSDLPERVDVLVIGAGPAGLAAAGELTRRRPEASLLVVEAEDAVGGRVRTNVVDGFLLDRGFQVLNTAYPEVIEQLDLDALALQPFVAGAAVRRAGSFQLIADPRRHPRLATRTLQANIGSLGDKLRTGRLALAQRDVGPHPTDQPDETSAQLLVDAGTGAFGELMLGAFFRGVFLEPELQTSARKLRWLLRVFGSGDSSLPVGGMGQVTRQLAARLPDQSVLLETRVLGLERIAAADGGGAGSWRVRLDGGRSVEATCVIVATEQASAARLVDEVAPDAVQAPSRDVSPTSITHYYGLPVAPADDRPVLLLGTSDDGPITNAGLLSNVQPGYAPEGRALLQATVVPDADTTDDAEALEQEVRTQLRGWFGPSIEGWELLRTDHLKQCLPFFAPGTYGTVRPAKVSTGLYLAGDHVDGATLDGALRSGRVAGADVAYAVAQPSHV